MKKVSETYVCDICGIEETKMLAVIYPVLFATEQTGGTCVKPYVTQKEIDMCKECLIKVIKIQGSGAQGHNTYRLIK